MNIDCGMQQATRIFKNRNALLEAIALLPKELGKVLKDMTDQYVKKQLNELYKTLCVNMEKLAIKVVVDKKSEKNFLYFIKYQTKEETKALKGDLEVFNKKFRSIFRAYSIKLM